MPDELRLIAIHVEEPKPGRFAWVITERAHDGRWSEVDQATHRTHTYKEAMADGLAALEKLVPDLDKGPRQSTGPALRNRDVTELESSGESLPSDEKEQAPAPAVSRNGHFGFGPIR